MNGLIGYRLGLGLKIFKCVGCYGRDGYSVVGQK